jgi:hypothetical protein
METCAAHGLSSLCSVQRSAIMIVESMEQHILERIRREFQDADQNCVVELLASYSGPESDRVRWDILELSKGNLEKVREYVKTAQTDYRDILYWAEYYENDSMLRGRDAKRVVSWPAGERKRNERLFAVTAYDSSRTAFASRLWVLSSICFFSATFPNQRT